MKRKLFEFFTTITSSLSSAAICIKRAAALPLLKKPVHDCGLLTTFKPFA